MTNGVYSGLIRHRLLAHVGHKNGHVYHTGHKGGPTPIYGMTHTGATATDVAQNALAAPIQDAATSLTSMSNPCDLTANCATVKNFQNAWNAAGQGTKLTVDGYYGPNTQAAAAQIIGPAAPPACGATAYTGACAGQPAAAQPAAVTQAASSQSAPLQAGFFSGKKLWWIAGALAVLVLGFLGMRQSKHGHAF